MKIIHCADIHLGSKMDNTFSKEIAEKRKSALRNSFSRMVDYAKENGIKVIVLSGDVFDSDRPFKKDKDFLYSVIEKNPEIDFLYLRGNHDIGGDSENNYENLKTFTDKWLSYKYNNVTISGIEITAENCTSFYSTLNLEKDACNIVMLHGQIASGMGKDKINLSKLRDKNIDYLALGHVHEYKSEMIDDRGKWAYSGCLEGRGFDETGEKGFIQIDISNGDVRLEFVPFVENEIIEMSIDISDIKDAYSASLAVRKAIAFDKQNIYRIILTGDVDYTVDDLSADVEKYLSAYCLLVRVKDKTHRKIDINAFDGDTSLKGEFVRTVYASDYSDEDKIRIISYGLKALANERGLE